jgi:lipopolysaccharide/colanic/teichoic acid biosynthesis glycosyltransferase
MTIQSGAIRTCDIAGSALLLGILGLPMVAIALAIRLSDGGPAIFRQQRIGRNCRPFTVLKFRTMLVDTSGANLGIPSQGERSEEARLRFRRTEPGDVRITPMGKFLRPSHLDELPQLVNILRGDMSFVGVRPDTPVQEGDYSPEFWRQRHALRPGLTGPAQLRTDPLNFAQRGEEELRWLNDPTLSGYLTYLFRTVRKVLTRSSF